MNAALWLAAGLACAQPGPPASSKIEAVTVYQGQALVSRAVSVPEGDGTIELVVSPLPAQVVEGSLHAEGSDGLRVLSTRSRARAVKDDSRDAVRAVEDRLKTLHADAERLRKEALARQQDLQYLQKLEGFTGTALNGLTARGRFDSTGIIALSRFVMESRGEKTKAETDLRRELQANDEAAEFARRQLTELAAGPARVERDAVIVVHRGRRDKGTVRLGYLAGPATWRPQYRLRGAADDAPVRLEYLAAVVQQTGEDWSDVRVTLSTARPSLDAAPPELLPLKMAVAGAEDADPIEARDERSRKILAELEKPINMPFANETSLEDVIKYVRSATISPSYPEGIPIYVDPVGLQEAEKTTASTVAIDLTRVPLRTSFKLLLEQLGLVYRVEDGLLKVTSKDSEAPGFEGGARLRDGFEGRADGLAMTPEEDPASGGAALNREAAQGQTEELRVADGPGPRPGAEPAEKDDPGVTFAVAGRLDLPSRRDPQLLEVARVALPAEYHFKAVPVLTPRVYRLATLTNAGESVLLPGEAAVYVEGEFVGRMRLPLVAVGEPFLVGFGVDPQLQVTRRLIHKARSVQGGNQIFTYEFRIGLRNYRPGPVKVQLWDRLPKPEGEAVAVDLVKTSAELSVDPRYLRTARLDNLLRWDLVVPPGTVGDKTMYQTYEFKLEYARDLPRPRFLSGDLKEGPIGGGAMGGGMGGMGGMGGGFRSLRPGGN